MHSLSRTANTSKLESTLGSGRTIPQLNHLPVKPWRMDAKRWNSFSFSAFQQKPESSVATLTGKFNSSNPSLHWNSLLDSCLGTVFHITELLSKGRYQLWALRLFFRVLLVNVLRVFTSAWCLHLTVTPSRSLSHGGLPKPKALFTLDHIRCLTQIRVSN